MALYIGVFNPLLSFFACYGRDLCIMLYKVVFNPNIWSSYQGVLYVSNHSLIHRPDFRSRSRHTVMCCVAKRNV